jgi:outer membrane protein
MKYTLKFTAVAVWAVLSGCLALAQTPASKAAPTKIGVVDVVRALSDTVEGKQEFALIQDWAAAESDSLKKLEAEYATLRERHMQEQLRMSPEARAEMERHIQDTETRLRRRQEDLNQELALKRQELLNRMGGKLQTVLQEYAQQNNYLAILVAQEGIFAYVAPAGDLTDQIRQLYDSRYPVKAPAPKLERP